MKLTFNLTIDVPEPEKLAEQVYDWIYVQDYCDNDSIETAMWDEIRDTLDDIELEEIYKQLPKSYIEKYNKTLNRLKNVR